MNILLCKNLLIMPCRVSVGTHPGVWIAKGSSVPIALEGPDISVLIASNLHLINCSHNMKRVRMGGIILRSVMFWQFLSFVPLKQVGASH